MLTITIPESEQWNEIEERFVSTKKQTIQLEHSLVSIYKWESKWHIPFISKEPKTAEQTIDYIKCMTITQNVSSDVYLNITPDIYKQIEEYIDDPMTATWFSKDSNTKSSREIITAEKIYYWMIALKIPFECQKWHLNKLLTLIRVCEAENRPKKKMSRREIMRRNTALNAARRKKLNTKG